MDEKTQTQLEEFLNSCMTLKDAIEKAFDEYTENDDHFEVNCCGQPISIYSGIMGNDLGECKICGAEIRLIISPHVSPLLLDMERSVTHAPTDEFIAQVGDRCWYVKEGNKNG